MTRPHLWGVAKSTNCFIQIKAWAQLLWRVSDIHSRHHLIIFMVKKNCFRASSTPGGRHSIIYNKEKTPPEPIVGTPRGENQSSTLDFDKKASKKNFWNIFLWPDEKIRWKTDQMMKDYSWKKLLVKSYSIICSACVVLLYFIDSKCWVTGGCWWCGKRQTKKTN